MSLELKADLHLHSGDDPLDYVVHSTEDLIDHAVGLGFEVLAVTNHDRMTYSRELAEYAADRGIILLSGVEATVENRHVLLYNFDYRADPPATFDDLYRVKARNPEMFILAPHPFFPSQFCLQRRLLEHLELFDGIEFSRFYTRRMNFNRRAVRLARRTGRTLVGTSDSHFLWQMGTTYSELSVRQRSVEGVLEALRTGRVRVCTQPLHVREVLFQFRKYPSLKVKRLAFRNGYRSETENRIF